jgi:hypothetical protein
MRSAASARSAIGRDRLARDCVPALGSAAQAAIGRAVAFKAVEGQKVLLRQFARNIDKALRPLLTGSGIPLVLATAEPLASASIVR